MRILWLLLCLPLVAHADADPLAAWKPLLGEWVAEGSPAGHFSFAADLGGKVVVRKNHAEGPAANGRPAFSHDDLLVLWPAAEGTRAQYWDNEGHVIEYACSAEPAKWTCTTHGTKPAFRLEYKASTPGKLDITFSIAPSGNEAELKPYLHGTAHKR